MPKTAFSKRCNILAAFYQEHYDEAMEMDGWREFMDSTRFFLPLSWGVSAGMIDSLSKDGREMIDNTWTLWCAYLGIDKDAEYNTLDECLEVSGE